MKSPFTKSLIFLIILLGSLTITIDEALACYTVTVTATPKYILADGRSNSYIKAYVTDPEGKPVYTNVDFSIQPSIGSIRKTSAMTAIYTSSTIPAKIQVIAKVKIKTKVGTQTFVGYTYVYVVKVEVEGPKFVAVDKIATFKAVITPSVPGQYNWAITQGSDKAKIISPSTGATVTVQGIKPSRRIDDVTLRLMFRPQGVSYWLRPVYHRVTVVGVEIENISPRDSDDIQIQNKIDDAIPALIYYKILPEFSFAPKGVKLKVLDASGNIVRERTLPTLVGKRSTTWDGKDNSGKFVTYGYYRAIIEVTAADVVIPSNTHKLTVYMVRLGNNVYRHMEWLLNEHSGILYAYTGTKNVRKELDDTSKYSVIEQPGTFTRLTTLKSFIAVFGFYYGPYCPNINKEQRKRILSTASLYRPYIRDIHHILEYDDSTWKRTIANIARIRCDGINEVSYEASGILLWGSNLMSSQTNLEQHYNDLGFTKGCTPRRQRLGGGGGGTSNRKDYLYLPRE